MKKLFGILPLFGSLGFFWGAYLFFETARQISAWAYFGMGLFGLCGIGFLIWGLGMLVQIKDESVSYKDGQLLKISGAKIIASILHLEQVTNIKVNGRSPYVIHAKGIHPSTGQEQIFKSFWLWSDPFAQAQAGREIDVYVDKYNPQKYYLDVESIGLPAKQARSNNIAMLAVIIPVVILIVAGIIGAVMYQKNNNSGGLLDGDSNNLQTMSEYNASAECMKRLYGEDVFIKIQQGKFVPPTDIAVKMQECERQR